MKLKLKFTPGPWLREGRFIYTLQSAGFKKGKEQFENRFGAVFQPGKTCPIEEAEANARLAQAAPEMYALLAEFKRVHFICELMPGAVMSEIQDMFKQAKDLVVKINGEPEVK